jgi:hypothetical protein
MKENPRDEVAHLREVEEAGESDATPALAGAHVLTVIIPLTLIMTAAVYLAVRLVT